MPPGDPERDVRVGPATVEDLDALVELWVALVADQRDHGAHLLAEENRSTARDFLGQHVAGDRVLVARDGDALVGFATFHVESGAYEQDTTRGVVDNVYVAPPYRDAGVGSALLDAAEAELAARGADTLSLSVLAGNDGARRLYERRGYRPHRVTLERPAESDTHTRDDG
ncbi:MAG: N-acetyltransferase family protein [Halobacteriaceae archaeon]